MSTRSQIRLSDPCFDDVLGLEKLVWKDKSLRVTVLWKYLLRLDTGVCALTQSWPVTGVDTSLCMVPTTVQQAWAWRRPKAWQISQLLGTSVSFVQVGDGVVFLTPLGGRRAMLEVVQDHWSWSGRLQGMFASYNKLASRISKRENIISVSIKGVPKHIK